MSARSRISAIIVGSAALARGRARASGNVWATRRLAGLPSGAFLEIEADGTASG
jgi:hypothetical protein